MAQKSIQAQTHVLISGAIHADALSMFQSQKNLTIEYLPDAPRAVLDEKIKTAHVLVSRSETDVDRALIDRAPLLKVIARAAVGVGNIDIDYASERGILVINCPGKNTNSAAELTFGLMLGLMRHIDRAAAAISKGEWNRHRFTGRELRGKRIGIVGLGNVGHRVARFARGFEMEVMAFDPYIAPDMFERYGAVQAHSMLELVKQSDILTMHVPLNKETKYMLTEDMIAALPKGAIIVNAARGGLADEKVLLKYLNSGHLAGVAIDTWEKEPNTNTALASHERVIGTPHIGASTDEAQIAIGTTVYTQVMKALSGSVVDYPVNMPNVGVIDKPVLKSYAVLAEKLGAFVGQTIDFNPIKVEFNYRGDLARLDHSIIRLGWMKGYVGHILDDYISFVNVTAKFDSLGIKAVETEDPEFESFKSALKVSIYGPEGRKMTIGGLVFDDVLPRISLINDYYFEIDPTGTLILIENNDVPGVVGDLGHMLAKNGINIDTFALSRNKKGGKAMALIRVDNEPQLADMEQLKKIKNVLSAHLVRL